MFSQKNRTYRLKNSHLQDPHPVGKISLSDGNPLIRLVNLSKVYRSAAGNFPALQQINLEIQRGQFVGVVGKSGAGKSTLVNMLTGVDTLTEGECWVNGTPIHTLDENQVALWRGQNVGVVYQSFQLMPMLTLVDNVMLPMDFTGKFTPRPSREKAIQLLTAVELEEHIHKTPSLLSGGQQQRVAIARALANEPGILVADEPTGNLDTVTAEHIIQLFESLVAEGKTVIMATHDNAMSGRFTHLIQLSDGQVVHQEHRSKPVKRAP